MSRPPTKSFAEHFYELAKVAEKHNLTIREISLNTNVSEDLIRILFNNENNIIEDFSKLFEFFKYQIRKGRYGTFIVYRAFDNGEQIKIKRILHPRCSVYYDRETDDFYEFEFEQKHFNRSKIVSKKLIMREMYEFTKTHLKNLRETT